MSTGKVLPALEALARTLRISAFLLMLSIAHPGQAAPGDLDLAFGQGGKATTDFEGSFDFVEAIAIDKTGRIVVAGISNASSFALARYNPDGILDTTFGQDGKVITDFSGGEDRAFAVAIQDDGRIIAAGVAGFLTARADFALVRYNPDGTLDADFGEGGKVITDFSDGSRDTLFAMLIQPDGRIVAAGTSDASDSFDSTFALARYHPDGALDTKFGKGGKVTTNFGSRGDVASALAIDKGGQLVAAGFSNAGDPADRSKFDFVFALARFHPDGTLDVSFGEKGRVTIDIGNNVDDRAHAVVIQPDGKIVAAGHAGHDFNFDFALVRYDPNGALDSGFGLKGIVITDFNSRSYDFGKDLVIQSDGKLLVVGNTNATQLGKEFFGTTTHFAVARYASNGVLDTTFGEEGKVITGFTAFTSKDGAKAGAIQADGYITVAGGTRAADAKVGFDFNFALSRYRSEALTPVLAPGTTDQ